MHVALFLHRYPPAIGGAEQYAGRLAAHHAAQGDAVTVWTSTALDLTALTGPGRHLPESRAGDVRRYRPLAFPLRRYALKAASLVPHPPWQALTLPASPVMPRMWADAGTYAGPVDAVHALAFPHAFPAACGLRLARRRGVPFALTPFLHLGDPADPRDRTRRQYTSPTLRWLLRQADVVFAQTPSERAAVVGLGVPAERVVLQGLGVDPADCTSGDRDRARNAWGVAADDVVVGHLANLSAAKGSVDLLRVLDGVGHDIRGVFAGPAMPDFERAWARTSRPAVTRIGPMSDAAKRDFFAGIDVFALPSRVDSFGLVLLEAWANGKPAVVHRAGGPADLIRDGVDGLQVPCGDRPSLGRELIRLATDAALRRRLGEAGAARVAAGEFDWGRSLSVVTTALRIRLG